MLFQNTIIISWKMLHGFLLYVIYSSTWRETWLFNLHLKYNKDFSGQLLLHCLRQFHTHVCMYRQKQTTTDKIESKLEKFYVTCVLISWLGWMDGWMVDHIKCLSPRFAGIFCECLCGIGYTTPSMNIWDMWDVWNYLFFVINIFYGWRTWCRYSSSAFFLI